MPIQNIFHKFFSYIGVSTHLNDIWREMWTRKSNGSCRTHRAALLDEVLKYAIRFVAFNREKYFLGGRHMNLNPHFCGKMSKIWKILMKMWNNNGFTNSCQIIITWVCFYSDVRLVWFFFIITNIKCTFV